VKLRKDRAVTDNEQKYYNALVVISKRTWQSHDITIMLFDAGSGLEIMITQGDTKISTTLHSFFIQTMKEISRAIDDEKETDKNQPD